MVGTGRQRTGLHLLPLFLPSTLHPSGQDPLILTGEKAPLGAGGRLDETGGFWEPLTKPFNLCPLLSLLPGGAEAYLGAQLVPVPVPRGVRQLFKDTRGCWMHGALL